LRRVSRSLSRLQSRGLSGRLARHARGFSRRLVRRFPDARLQNLLERCFTGQKGNMTGIATLCNKTLNACLTSLFEYSPPTEYGPSLTSPLSAGDGCLGGVKQQPKSRGCARGFRGNKTNHLRATKQMKQIDDSKSQPGIGDFSTLQTSGAPSLDTFLRLQHHSAEVCSLGISRGAMPNTSPPRESSISKD
jgi:hypothetical protein